jgi:hypothetical protein
MTTTILQTRNEAWGFFGTLAQAGADAQQGWTAASAMIACATDAAPEGVRAFLDSRHGRHFADEVVGLTLSGAGLEAAIEATIDRWMGWRIGRRTSRETGIPAGLAYLTGFVSHCQILDEMDAEEADD